MFDLDGLTALVTGGSRGIGAATAEALARAGAHVCIAARDKAALRAACDRISPARGSLTPFPFDVKDPVASAAAISAINERYGGPDILINCAGTIARGTLQEVSDDAWDDVIDVNVTAAMRLSRAAAPSMVRKRWGRIINVSSIAALGGMTSRSAYCTSKAALLGLTRSLGAELGPFGITVNAVCPGSFPTDFNIPLQRDPEFQRRLEMTTPLKRWGRLEEIAMPILFLCSREASYITGHTLVVDGGATSSL